MDASCGVRGLGQVRLNSTWLIDVGEEVREPVFSEGQCILSSVVKPATLELRMASIRGEDSNKGLERHRYELAVSTHLSVLES